MPILLLEILETLEALASAEPAIAVLVQSAIKIVRSGDVTDAEAATIRAQLDVVARLIDEG